MLLAAETPAPKGSVLEKLMKVHQGEQQLEDWEAIVNDKASTPALKRLVLEAGVVAKWDALGDIVKTKANRFVAQLKVKRAEVKAAKQKAEADKNKKKPTLEEEMLPTTFTLPWWEQEWDTDKEAEALERMSKLAIWPTLDAQKIEMFLKRVRENPNFLNVMEQEEKQGLMLREAQEQAKEEGRELTYGDFQALGAKVHEFSDDEKADAKKKKK